MENKKTKWHYNFSESGLYVENMYAFKDRHSIIIKPYYKTIINGASCSHKFIGWEIHLQDTNTPCILHTFKINDIHIDRVRLRVEAIKRLEVILADERKIDEPKRKREWREVQKDLWFTKYHKGYQANLIGFEDADGVFHGYNLFIRNPHKGIPNKRFDICNITNKLAKKEAEEVFRQYIAEYH